MFPRGVGPQVNFASADAIFAALAAAIWALDRQLFSPLSFQDNLCFVSVVKTRAAVNADDAPLEYFFSARRHGYTSREQFAAVIRTRGGGK